MKIKGEQVNPLMLHLPGGLLFLLIFVYMSVFGEHVFFSQEKSSLFIFSTDYLNEYLHQPGSLLVFFANFLTSFFYFPVAGSFISALVIWLIFVISSQIMFSLSGHKSITIPSLISLILFWLQIDYQYLLINNLGILLQLLFFFLVVRKRINWSALILFPVWFFITGGFCWIFCLMLMLFLLLERENKWLIKLFSLGLIIAITLWISAEYLFFQIPKIMVSFPWSDAGTGSQSILFFTAVLLIVIIPVIALTGPVKQFPGSMEPVKFHIAGSAVIIMLIGTISVMKYDKATISYFRVEKLFFEHRFGEVIDYNIKHPSSNYLTNYLNNIALCETGQLNDLLFSFPQSPDGNTLFLKWEIIGEILRKGGYFYYTTGMINEAHRWAFEYMVMKGHTPEALKMLIKTELISGNYQNASKYISVMKKSLFYRKDAMKFERLLFNDHAVESDPELGPKRRIRTKKDFFTITDNPLINLRRVIATDSLNKPAFEYALAYLLITKEYENIMTEWKNFGRYGYSKIPTHIEEAGVAIKNLYNQQLPYASGLRINPETEIRFNQYLQTFQNFGANPKSAEPELRKRFGNTFWYWVFYK